MQARSYWICILVIAIWIPHAWADIYSWMDADGVRHISNLNPPAHAEVPILTEEQDFDEVTVQAPQEAEMQLREREARLARQKVELERRIDKTEQKAQDALQEAEQRLAAAEARWETNRRYVIPTVAYVYRPYGGPHYRHTPSRYRPGHRLGRPSLTGRPFHLGPIHLPLGTIGLTRRPDAGGAARHPLHPVGCQR